MLPKGNELLSRLLYKPIWRFFESIHNCIVGTWDWIVEELGPFAGAAFKLTVVLLFLVILLRACFQ